MEQPRSNTISVAVPKAREPATVIRDFHAHLYFDAAEAEEARTFAQIVARRFSVAMGHVHTRPVGPHPRGSCQLTLTLAQFGEVVPWLAINRGKFTILVHPSTGDDVADHLLHALWLGPSEQLIAPPGMS
jgi:DOPA 4,5-dioxygenase